MSIIITPYPPIASGTRVKTTTSKSSDWTEATKATRRWGVFGTVMVHHDSHGLCYEVQHDDGTISCYTPDELEIVK